MPIILIFNKTVLRYLLLDSGFSAEPLYDSLGLEADERIVIGNRPSDMLAKRADRYINQDYSDIERVREILKKYRVNSLLPGCTDLSYEVCSTFSEDKTLINIDSSELTRTLAEKKKFRDVCKNLGIAAPTVFHESSLPKSQKIIIKPTDSYSGKGIAVVESLNELEIKKKVAEARSVSRTGEVVLEELVEGGLYSTSAFVKDGRVVCSIVVEEHCISNQFSVDVSRVVENSFHQNKQNSINQIEEIAKKFLLADGLVHVQWIDTPEASVFIELTRRCPGDLYSLLVSRSVGLDYAKLYAQGFLRDSTSDYKMRDEIDPWIRVTVTGVVGSRYSGFNFNGKSASRVAFYPTLQRGSFIQGAGRVGVAFVQSSDQSELFSMALDRKLFQVF